MIACYAVFMVFGGIFTLISYTGGKLRDNLMKFCLVVNSLYAMAGIMFLGMMIQSKLM